MIWHTRKIRVHRETGEELSEQQAKKKYIKVKTNKTTHYNGDTAIVTITEVYTEDRQQKLNL